MDRGWLLLIGLTAFNSFAFGAEEEVGKLLEQRLNSENADQAKQEQAVIAKGKRLATLTEGNAVIKDLETLQAAIERWESQMKAILTSAEGQALASDPMSVEDFINLQEGKRYPLIQVQGMRSQVQSMLTPLQAASDNSLYAPTEALVVEIRTASKDAKEALTEYDRLQAKWRVLLQRTKGIQVSPNSPTLAAAIDQAKEEQAKRELEAQQVARNQAKYNIQKRITEAEASKQEEVARQEIERLNQEKEQIRQQAERQRFAQRATSSATLSRFQPYLAPGRRMLRGNSCRWGGMDIHNNPVSYGDMLVCGALKNVKRFVAHANLQDNDRPKWKSPTTEADWVEMEKRLEEFNLYAEIWIEKGILGK